MNKSTININFVSSILGNFYSSVGNPKSILDQKMEQDMNKLALLSNEITEMGSFFWQNKDISFAGNELKQVNKLYQFISLSYTVMKLAGKYTDNEVTQAYISEFEKLSLSIKSVQNILKNIIRTTQHPQEYEKINQNAILDEPIWENDERTLESIRKQAWQRTF